MTYKKGTLVLLSGKARSGKDTAGELLVDVLEGDTELLAFAKPLKDVAGLMYDLSEEQLYGDLKDAPIEDMYEEFQAPSVMETDWTEESLMRWVLSLNPKLKRFADAGLLKVHDLPSGTLRKYISPRVILQDIGEAARAIYLETWVRKAWNRAKELLSDGNNAVITDCRHGNEAELLREARAMGHKALGLYMKREQAHSVAEHVSEKHEWLPEYRDVFIDFDNNGEGKEGLADLKSRLKEAVEHA